MAENTGETNRVPPLEEGFKMLEDLAEGAKNLGKYFGGGTAPMKGGHNWASFSHKALYDSVHSNNDPGETGAIAAEWKQLGQDLIDSATDFKKAITESESGWTGTGADAARAAMDTLSTWVSNTGGVVNDVGERLQAQGELMSETKSRMPPPVEFDLNARLNASTQGGIEAFAEAMKDAQVAQETAQAAHDQAVRVMQDMEYRANQIALGLTAFETPVNPVSASGSDPQLNSLNPTVDNPSGNDPSGNDPRLDRLNPTGDDPRLDSLNPTVDDPSGNDPRLDSLNPSADEQNRLGTNEDGELNALNPSSDSLLNDLTPTASNGEQLRSAVLPSDSTQTSSVAPPTSPSVPSGTFTNPSANSFPTGIPQQFSQDTTLPSSKLLGKVPTNIPSTASPKLQNRVPTSGGRQDPSFTGTPPQTRPSGSFTNRPGGPSNSPSVPSSLTGRTGGSFSPSGSGVSSNLVTPGSPRVGGPGVNGFGPSGPSASSFGPSGPGVSSNLVTPGSPRVGGPGVNGFGGPGQPGGTSGAPVGGAPGGGGGKPEEDKEYGAADYLVGESIFDDPDDTIPPAVIGDFKPRTPKQDEVGR